MITQYSRVQLTLSEKEKEYAWVKYLGMLNEKGCRDQSMSGYSVTGTGNDGKEVTAELTNEELFNIFIEVSVKLTKRMMKEQFRDEDAQYEAQGIWQQESYPDPLRRRDFMITLTPHQLKTRKADVSITWANNLRIEGLHVHEGAGRVQVSVPAYFTKSGERVELFSVSPGLKAAILEGYREMKQGQERQNVRTYFAETAGTSIRTWESGEERIAGFASVMICDELQIRQVRIRDNGGKITSMYPSEAYVTKEGKQWHNLVTELPDCRLHEQIIDRFTRDQAIRKEKEEEKHRKEPEPDEEMEM